MMTSDTCIINLQVGTTYSTNVTLFRRTIIVSTRQLELVISRALVSMADYNLTYNPVVH